MSMTYSSPAIPFGRRETEEVCTLYNLTRAQEAMRQLFCPLRFHDRAGNVPELNEIYPDYLAPIIRHAADGFEMVKARWGLPTPLQFLIGKKTDRGVANVRNTSSPHWRRWLGPEHRCLVPFSSFSEPHFEQERNVWFSFEDERPAFFAGFHVPRWTSVRKLKDGDTTDDLFAFLTTEPNVEVRAIHPKAMPVILTDPDSWLTWMSVPWNEAAKLQKPLPDMALAWADAGVP